MPTYPKTLSRLRSFLDEPMCFGCGYSLRGSSAAATSCPECGRVGGRVGIRGAIRAMPWHRVPGMEVLLVPAAVMVLSPLVVAALTTAVYGLFGLWSLVVFVPLAMAAWGLTVSHAVRDFESWRVLPMLALSHVAVSLFTIGVAVVMVSVVASIVAWGEGRAHDRFDELVLFYLAGALAVAGSWAIRSAVVAACRRRCQATCDDRLAGSVTTPVSPRDSPTSSR